MWFVGGVQIDFDCGVWYVEGDVSEYMGVVGDLEEYSAGTEGTGDIRNLPRDADDLDLRTSLAETEVDRLG